MKYREAGKQIDTDEGKQVKGRQKTDRYRNKRTG